MIYKKNIKPTCIWNIKASLGEGVVWVEAEHSVYFVDILMCRIHRYHLKTQIKTNWETPNKPTFIFPTTQPTLFLCGMADGLYWFDRQIGKFQKWFSLNEEYPHNRINDGYIDHLGRLWFGTMDDNEQEENGSLYLLQWDMALNPIIIRQDTGYVVTNGPIIGEGEQHLYHNHSNAQHVYMFDMPSCDYIENKHLLIKIDEGYPDGMAFDQSKNLWICLYNGYHIRVYSHDGRHLQSIPFPCPNITKIAFGGDDYKTAFVTTAIKGMNEDEKNQYPLAGGLFSFEVDIPGKAQNLFYAPENIVLK